MVLAVALITPLFLGLLPWKDIFIVDGTTAKLGQIPYQVSLQYNGSHFCGGVLIDTQTILTAAHCFDHYQPTFFKAVAGIVNIKSGLGTTGQEANINHGLIHSGYNRVTFANDIAVLKTDSPFKTSPYVGSALLPQTSSTPSGLAIVSGWGRTEENAPLSQQLLDAELEVLTQEQCQEIYGEDVTTSVFCAGPLPNGNQDSCQGDSGGPVMCVENGESVLCGLVSAGIGCGDKDNPGVYTSVSYFKPWIINVP